MNVSSGWLAVPGIAKVLRDSNHAAAYKQKGTSEAEHKEHIMEKPKDNPEITEHLQPSVVVLLFRLLGAIFLLDTVYSFLILGFFSLNNVHDWHDPYVLLLWLADIAKFLIITAMAIKIFAQWAGRNYYIHGHHLVERLGLVNITETTHELSQVKSVIVRQTWLGRRFNYGTIKLNFAGSAPVEEVVLRDITNPAKYKDYFDQHMQVQGWIR